MGARKIVLLIVGVLVIGIAAFLVLNLRAPGGAVERPVGEEPSTSVPAAPETSTTTTDDSAARYAEIQEAVKAGTLSPEEAASIPPPTIPPPID